MVFLLPAGLAGEETPGTDHIESGKFKLITQEEERISAHRLAQQSQENIGGGRDEPVLHKIPESYLETGRAEWIEYQLPIDHDPEDPPYPMIVCWHGYGQSCRSVSLDSLIDEECTERNWIFLSITGAWQCHFGCLLAQYHCTKAIQYVIEELRFNVDLDRIYMAGFSMGGGAAASYASRHLSEQEGYPVAGLIVVAPTFDWMHAYDQNDPGVQYWLPLLIGQPPASAPFEYKRISTLSIKDGSTYELQESMGQNMRHNMPVFITYAGNDPLVYGPIQNNIFHAMMSDLEANVIVDYQPSSATPHHWQLLDLETALDFIEAYTLEDHETKTLSVLSDREASYYWAGMDQSSADAFSHFGGQASPWQNKLTIKSTDNVDEISVDCAKAGLNDQANLRIAYETSPASAQALKLQPLSKTPTYVVDQQGVLYPYYSYGQPEQQVSILCPPVQNPGFTISFEAYNLSLTASEKAGLDELVFISLGGGDPYDAYLFFFSATQVETPVGIHHLLVYPFSPTIWYFSVLDDTGAGSLNVLVPNDPQALGMVIFQQFVTYDVMLKEKSNLATTTIE
jgi:pimeloyl-ACP methyl ester carboxylesterase